MDRSFPMGTEIDDRIDPQFSDPLYILFACAMHRGATEKLTLFYGLPISCPDPAQIAEVLDHLDRIFILYLFLHISN